jgi:hypothetical protein
LGSLWHSLFFLKAPDHYRQVFAFKGVPTTKVECHCQAPQGGRESGPIMVIAADKTGTLHPSLHQHYKWL